MLIKCSDLKTLEESLRKHELNPVLTLAIAIASKYEGMGRVGLSKYLSLRERLVRRVMDFLKRGDPSLINIMSSVINILGIHVLSIDDDKAIVLYTKLDTEIIELVSRFVIYFRDYVVIFSANPNKIEAVGIVMDDKITYPGMPPEIEMHYVKHVERFMPRSNGIVVWFKNYRKYLDDAVFIVSVLMLCSRNLCRSIDRYDDLSFTSID